MRKTGNRWHDQRLIDLLTVMALGIVIVSALLYCRRHDVSAQASFIVPSESVRW